MSGLVRPTATGWPQLCATSSLSNPLHVYNRTVAELHSWTLGHHSWLHQGAHKQSVSCSSSLSCSTYTRAVVVSYSEYVLVTQIPQKFDSHGSLQTHLVTGIVHMKMMMKAMTMFSVESAQSTKQAGQQPAAPDGPHTSPLTQSYTLTPRHTYTLTHTYTHAHLHIHTRTLTPMHINISWHWKQHLLSHTDILNINVLNHTVCVILLTYTLSHWSSYTPTLFLVYFHLNDKDAYRRLCYGAVAISGRRGADASIHISTYGCLPITTCLVWLG